MRKFQCLLFVLKRSYTCHYVICMTEPLIGQHQIKGKSDIKVKNPLTHFRTMFNF